MTELNSAEIKSIKDSIRKEARTQFAKLVIASFVALVTFAIMGWWLYFKPQLIKIFGGVPKGAVVAFADAPTGNAKRDCNSIGPEWDYFSAGEGRFLLGAGENYNTGDSGGEAEQILSLEQMPEHKHGVYAQRIGSIYDKNGRELRLMSPNASNPNEPANQETTVVGKGESINNMPPYIALTFCKKIE